MKLTKEEEKLILQRRKKEEENIPRMTGVLKHDLYYIWDKIIETPHEFLVKEHNQKGGYASIEDYKEYLKSAENEINNLTPNLTKGTKFVCYFEKGEECWYDVDADGDIGTEVDGIGAEWARENLVDIKDV